VRFIIDLWPDMDASADPHKALLWAIERVRENGEQLAWDVEDDSGNPLATDYVPANNEEENK
jgi:hypothetical protein